MKLSEAIRLGALVSPQCFRDYYKPDSKATCALGSAAWAIGLDLVAVSRQENYSSLETKLRNIFPILCLPPNNPRTSPEDSTLLDFIITLNDDYGWTRQQIADYIETIEAANPELSTERTPSVVEAVVQPQQKSIAGIAQ